MEHAEKRRHADECKNLGYVVVTYGPLPGKEGYFPQLGSSRVFGRKIRAERFASTIDPSWKPQVCRVREETEREAHRWGDLT
jgi:hypothetical protein